MMINSICKFNDNTAHLPHDEMNGLIHVQSFSDGILNILVGARIFFSKEVQKAQHSMLVIMISDIQKIVNSKKKKKTHILQMKICAFLAPIPLDYCNQNTRNTR
jgi:uncharacterized membrane protein